MARHRAGWGGGIPAAQTHQVMGRTRRRLAAPSRLGPLRARRCARERARPHLRVRRGLVRLPPQEQQQRRLVVQLTQLGAGAQGVERAWCQRCSCWPALGSAAWAWATDSNARLAPGQALP